MAPALSCSGRPESKEIAAGVLERRLETQYLKRLRAAMAALRVNHIKLIRLEGVSEAYFQHASKGIVSLGIVA